MGGTGKSEVIKAFKFFIQRLSKQLGWHFDSNTIKTTAYTGSAACELDDATTLHSAVGLNNKKKLSAITPLWKNTKMLIIDEVSFLGIKDLIKLDKNMRIISNNQNYFYCHIHIVFFGDFRQLLPVKATPLFREKTLQSEAINKAIFDIIVILLHFSLVRIIPYILNLIFARYKCLLNP